jgi:hypothetical protein
MLCKIFTVPLGRMQIKGVSRSEENFKENMTDEIGVYKLRVSRKRGCQGDKASSLLFAEHGDHPAELSRLVLFSLAIDA